MTLAELRARVAQPARVGLWVDLDFCGRLTPAMLVALSAYTHPEHGKVVGIFGYSELPGENVDGTVWTAASLGYVIDAGYQAGWIQHPLNPGWVPSENLAATHVTHASAYAESVGFPRAMHGGMDIECTGGPSLGYAAIWSHLRKLMAGASTLGYYGYELGMLLSEFEALPDVDSYWRAFNQAALGGRGPCVTQGPTITIPGFGQVDIDVVAPDAHGDVFTAAAAAGPADVA